MWAWARELLGRALPAWGALEEGAQRRPGGRPGGRPKGGPQTGLELRGRARAGNTL